MKIKLKLHIMNNSLNMYPCESTLYMEAPRPSFNLGSFLEKDKLKTDGTNFTNLFRTLRILLAPLKMAYILEGALGDAPTDDASQDEKNVYLSRTDDYNLVQSGMLYSMEAKLQKHSEKMGASAA